jgi:SAM-dependent methyltransferase
MQAKIPGNIHSSHVRRGILFLLSLVPGGNYCKLNLPDIYQPSNIYVPGFPGIRLPDRTPDSRTLYSDREVALLPYLGAVHARDREWVSRAASADRLVRYLAEHKRDAGILEIGCGNGWLSRQLSTVPGSRVVGLDSNFGELRQAARVFRRQANLKFIYGDFYSAVLQDLSFDIIVMAATVHCFPSTHRIIRDALGYLRPHGELHLLDSPLCKPVLNEFRHRVQYDPRAFWNRMLRKDQRHPWVSITTPPPRAFA